MELRGAVQQADLEQMPGAGDTKCGRGCGAAGCSLPAVGVSCVDSGKLLGRVCYTGHTPVPWPGNSAPGDTLKTYLCPLHDTDRMFRAGLFTRAPATLVQQLQCVYTVRSYSAATRPPAVTCKTGGVQRHNAEWKKPDTKEHILPDSTA